METTPDASEVPPTVRSTPTDGARALEAAQARLQALLALTDSALAYRALDDLLRELLGRVTVVLQVDQIAIFLLDEDGRTLTLRAARGMLGEAIGHGRATLGRGFIGRIAASREPAILNAPADADYDRAPPRLRAQVRALAAVPLLVADPSDGPRMSRLVGALAVGSTTPRQFTEVDAQLLQRVADRIALAIDHALVYAAEREARRRAEAALSRALVSETQATERAAQLHTILETIADGVAVYDAAGRPLQTNRAYRELFALGRGPAEFEALPPLERAALLQLRDAAGAPLPLGRNPASRALRGEVVTEPGEVLRARAFDGRELELNVRAAPMRGADGRITGAVTDIRDVTERNRLERERAAAHASEAAARAARQRMETFVATAAHDLRTPLTATAGYLDLAQHRTDQLAAAVHAAYPGLVPLVAAVGDRVGGASRSAERLKRLLGLLFDAAAIRSGKLELHRAPCDLATLVRDEVAALRVAAPDRTIRLRAPAGGRPMLVEADAARIGEVVMNLVSNALKYSPPDRPVDVSVQARREGGRVAVRDAGPGIPTAEQAHLWELYHRVPGVGPQGNATGGSLGLGLYIAKAIIAAHGGQIGVRSAVGKGSTFRLTLPLAAATPLPAEQ
jgi:signal transduction histidine kinase